MTHYYHLGAFDPTKDLTILELCPSNKVKTAIEVLVVSIKHQINPEAFPIPSDKAYHIL